MIKNQNESSNQDKIIQKIAMILIDTQANSKAII